MQFHFDPFPVLTSPRLRLRKIESFDAGEIFAFRSDPAVMKYIDRPLMRDLEEANIFIQKINSDLHTNSGITWGITLKEDNKLVGAIGFWKMDPENFRAEIGYMLRADLRGKGFTQEALSVVLQFGFAVLNLHSVEANANPANEASIKLLEKNGFAREGYFRENYFFDGRFLDSAVYSLINSGSEHT